MYLQIPVFEFFHTMMWVHHIEITFQHAILEIKLKINKIDVSEFLTFIWSSEDSAISFQQNCEDTV